MTSHTNLQCLQTLTIQAVVWSGPHALFCTTNVSSFISGHFVYLYLQGPAATYGSALPLGRQEYSNVISFMRFILYLLTAIQKMKNVWVKKVGSTFMELFWNLDCLDRNGLVEGFRIYYCPVQHKGPECKSE